jgi:DNA polymerase III subunit epsilon
MDFVALDVETANADMTSICQVGFARFESGVLVHEWKSYVDPEDYFDAVNVSIHGINEHAVRGNAVKDFSCLKIGYLRNWWRKRR